MVKSKNKILKIFFIFLILISLNIAAASRLPTIGGDESTWGKILNEYLKNLAGENATQLNLTMVNGTNIYFDTINSSHLTANSVGDDAINYSQITLNDFTNDANYLDKDEDGIINGNLIVNGNMTVIGDYFNASVTNQYLNGSFFPDITNFFDLGSSLLKWAKLYVTDIYASKVYSNDWSNVTITESQINDLQSYLTSESDPSWNNNYSAFNESWSSTFNQTTNDSINNYVLYVNSTNAASSGYDDDWINSTLVPYSGANQNVDLGENNLIVDTNTLFVDSANNNVGINTTSPNYPLTVNGNVSMIGSADRFIIGGPVGTNKINMYSSDLGGFDFYTLNNAASSRFYGNVHATGDIVAAGKLQFGTTFNTGQSGTISGGSAWVDNSYISLYDGATGNFYFSTGKRLQGLFGWFVNETQRVMTLTKYGTLGIGASTTPQSDVKLQVFGNELVNGSILASGTINSTNGFGVGTNSGITANYSIAGGECFLTITGGLITKSNCTAI